MAHPPADEPPAPRCPDDRCDGTGFVVDEATRTAFDCSCRPRRKAQRRAGRRRLVLPERYRGVAFDRHPVPAIRAASDRNDAIVGAVRRYCDDLERHVREGDGLALLGEKGVGKTTLLMLIAASASERQLTVEVASAASLMSRLRATYDQDADTSLVQLLDRLIEVDLLALDDVLAVRPTEWAQERLYEIVNARYEHRRPIVLSADAPFLAALEPALGARTVSRLLEMCGSRELPLEGEDARVFV